MRERNQSPCYSDAPPGNFSLTKMFEMAANEQERLFGLRPVDGVGCMSEPPMRFSAAEEAFLEDAWVGSRTPPSVQSIMPQLKRCIRYLLDLGNSCSGLPDHPLLLV